MRFCTPDRPNICQPVRWPSHLLHLRHLQAKTNEYTRYVSADISYSAATTRQWPLRFDLILMLALRHKKELTYMQAMLVTKTNILCARDEQDSWRKGCLSSKSCMSGCKYHFLPRHRIAYTKSLGRNLGLCFVQCNASSKNRRRQIPDQMNQAK